MKEKNKNLLQLIVISGYLFIIPAKVLASGAPPKITDGALTEILDKILFDIGYPFAFLVGLIMVVIAGYMWMTSSGDAQKIQTAQGTITWAVLGLAFLSVFGLILKEIFVWLGV